MQIKIKIGQRFGRWTVIERREDDERGTRWLCHCECGNEKIVRRQVLANGESKSCGCLKSELVAARSSIQNRKLIPPGTRFERLTVIKEQNPNKISHMTYLCRCDCGNETIVDGAMLRNGHTKSCGCYNVDIARKRATKHGFYRFVWFRAWRQRARAESEAGWTKEMEEMLHALQPRCVICGSTEYLEVDHVHPASKLHPLAPGNAIVLCRFHNRSKLAKDLTQLPIEWQEKIESAAQEFLDAWERRGE